VGCALRVAGLGVHVVGCGFKGFCLFLEMNGAKEIIYFFSINFLQEPVAQPALEGN
jgi:hypothetical protein